MLYNFLNDSTIKSINLSAKDLNLNIIQFEKKGIVTAADSIPIVEEIIEELRQQSLDNKEDLLEEESLLELNQMKFENSSNSHLIRRRKELSSRYKKSIDLLKDKQEEYDLRLDHLYSRLSEFKKDTLAVLSHKYEATYSWHMPDTDITRTLKGLAYSNQENTEIIGFIEQ